MELKFGLHNGNRTEIFYALTRRLRPTLFPVGEGRGATIKVGRADVE
jgi:hypothetical protein